MELSSAWVILVGAWALLNFWVLPLTQEHWLAADLKQKIARAGTVVALEKLRDLSLIGAAILGAVIVLVWANEAAASSAFLAPQTVIDALASSYNLAKAGGENFALVVSALGFIGAGVALYMAARDARQKIIDAWMAKAQEVHAQLTTDLRRLDEIHPDPESQKLVGLIKARLDWLHQPEGGTSHLTDNQKSDLQNEVASLLSILAIKIAEQRLDVQAALSTPLNQEVDTPPTPLQRVVRVLAASRLSKDLGLARRQISRVLTALLFVSLIGWSSAPLANSLQLAVNNLRINLAQADAERQLDEVLSAIKEKEDASRLQEQIDPSAQAVTRMLAQQVARVLVRSQILDTAAGTVRSAARESEFIRALIVGRQAAEEPGVSRVRKDVLDAVGGADNTGRTSTLQQHLERELRPHVEQMQREAPGVLARIVARLEMRYATPVDALDAQGQIVEKMVDEVLRGADVHPSTELGKQAQKIVKDIGKAALKTWIDNFAKHYVADLLLETVRVDVAKRAGPEFKFDVSAETSRFVRSLDEAQDLYWKEPAAARREAEVADKVAGTVARTTREDGPAAFLHGYDNLFPAGPTAGGGGLPSGHPPKGSPSFIRSRAVSFELASVSFRVRGVLIGREDRVAGLDVKDLEWAIQPSVDTTPTRVQLRFRNGTAWQELGRFDAAVVNQALRYAADGRVVATTIAGGDGRVIQRVTHLHPVLVDTPLGCRIVEADRFVDQFTSQADAPSRLAQLVTDRRNMMLWERTMRIAEDIASSSPDSRCAAELAPQLRKLFPVPVQFSPGLSAAVDRFLRTEEQENPGSTRLLRSAQTCATGERALLATCLCQPSWTSLLRSGPYWMPEDHTSQMRERQVTLGPDLQWIKRSKDRLGHVDFWLHTTLSLHHWTGPEPEADEATAKAIDFPVEALSVLRETIATELPKYLKSELNAPSYDDFMQPVEDFILLQRLMRSALSGRLGVDFPLPKLIQLEKATRNFVPKQPTIRWEAVGRDDEPMVAILKQADDRAAALYAAWKRDTLSRVLGDRPRCDRVSG